MPGGVLAWRIGKIETMIKKHKSRRCGARVEISCPAARNGSKSVERGWPASRERSPKGTDSELREELAERKAEILDFLRDVARRVASRLRPWADSRNQLLELSFAQQRLWMLDQMAQGRSAYHVGLHVRFEGPLSVVALRDAIAGLVRRHEALRTVFPRLTDGPCSKSAPFSSLTCR